MNKIGLVYWSRHFPKYMQKVVREYLTDKPSIRAEYMEYSREAQVQQKQRRELMYSTHQMTGPLLDRKDKEQLVFQTYSDHLPWIENKNYPEYDYFFLGLVKVKSLVTAPSPTVILSTIGLFLNFSCQQITS